MKKATSFCLVLGMIFLPCLNAFAQKAGRQSAEISVRDVKQTSRQRSRKGTDFESSSALTSGEEVLIRWTMRSETGNMGFYVHRIDQNGDIVINREIVYGSAAVAGRYPLYGEEYAFLDIYGDLNSVYYIEAVDLDGHKSFSRAISAQYSDTGIVRTPGMPTNSGDSGTKAGAFEFQQPNITKELASVIDRAALVPDPDKHKWVISHPGVRIDVNNEGIYRATFEQLQNAGFDVGDVGAEKTFWQLYRNGLEQAMIVDETNGYIEFYGKGVDTPETDTQGYFLINGDTAGKRIENMVTRPSTSSITLPSYNQTSTYKERGAYLDTVLNGDAGNHWGRGINSVGTDISFNLTGIDFNVATTTLELKAQGFSIGNHNIRVTLNGQLLDPVTGIAQFPFSGTQTIPTSLLKDADLGQGPNVLNLASVGPQGDFSLFDTVNLTFARKHSAAQDSLKAYTVSNKKTHITGFSSSAVRLYDITFENDPRLVTNISFQDEGGTFGTVLPSVRGRLIYAAEESKIMAPVAVTPNDGELLGVNTLGADLIIIAHRDFMTKADMWAAYRVGQGYSAKVVDVNEIFNEFNYGNLSAASMESFLEYAYTNWQTQPQYVLLIGDASRDPRNYEGGGNFNFVPTKMVTTVFTDTGSDEALADFDNNGLAELAIGRIPARDESQIDLIFNKVTKWEDNLGTDPLSRGALFAVDNFDTTNNIDFAAITDRIKAELPENTPKIVVNRSQPNSQTELIAAMNNQVCDGVCNSRGRYIVNYTGHGATGTWASTGFFWLANVSSLQNKDSESLMTMLTCLNGYFLFPTSNGLGEALLNHSNGGSVASWASTGLTTPDVQETMARRFYNKIGEGSMPRLGDLVKDAKSVVAGGTDVRLSFVLLGDPLLKVR